MACNRNIIQIRNCRIISLFSAINSIIAPDIVKHSVKMKSKVTERIQILLNKAIKLNNKCFL